MNPKPRHDSEHRRAPRLRSARAAAVSVAALAVLSACSSVKIPWVGDWSEPRERFDLIAVMPIERGAAPRGNGADGEVEPEAEAVVTAAIYGALSGTYEWRFVPDLTVTDAMRNIDPLDDAPDQARDLGKAVDADGVLFGSVSRYVERVGNADEAERPASVAFRLRLLSVRSGEVIWEQSYDYEQTSSREGFLAWLPLWEPGPAWLTAAELTHEGVAQLTEDLRRSLN